MQLYRKSCDFAMTMRFSERGIKIMKQSDLNAILGMLREGKSASEIALVLDISVNTIRSYIRRHPETFGGKCCKSCGKPLSQPEGRKEKRFCSDKCRMAWWNSHREQVRKKAYYTLTCTQCGKEFESYGNQNRKFCCRDCYLQSRHAFAAQNTGTIQGVSGNSEHHAA